MTGQKLRFVVLFVGIVLNFSVAKKSSIAIAYQAEDLRAIISDVITSELAALNSSASSTPGELALKLQGIKSSLEDIKETLMLSSVVLEHRLRSTTEDCGAMRTSLIGNHGNTTDRPVGGNSIKDTIHAMSSDIAAIKTRLASSGDANRASPTSEQYLTSEQPSTTEEVSSTTEQFPNWSTSPTVSPRISRNISLTEFDELIRGKPTARRGNTFNGSTVSEIMPRVSDVGDGGRGTVVVFINHLDRAINSFTMYDRNNSALHPAPSSIAPHTEEVFTFAEPSCCWIKTAFSYNIAGTNVRIASFMQFLWARSNAFGVAFVPPGASMETYFNTFQGIPGSYQTRKNIVQTTKFVVGYQNLYARMSVSGLEERKPVVIEVVEGVDGATSSDGITTDSSVLPDDEYYNA